MKFPSTVANNASLAGALASKKVLFGEGSRFALFAVHTRFSAVQWFVADAERPEKDGRPSIIRQAETPAEAVSGL